MNQKHFVFIVAFLVACLVGVGDANAQNFKFSATSASGSMGENIDLNLLFDNAMDDVQGWSVGVCHDNANLQVNFADNGAVTQAFNDGEGPDIIFYNAFDDPPLGPGWNAGVVISIAGQEVLPPGNDFDIHIVNYTLVGDPMGGEIMTDVCPCNEMVGDPATPNVVVVNGQSVAAPGNCGTVTITSGPIPFMYIVEDETINYNADSGEASFSIDVLVQENPENPGFVNDTQGFSVGLASDPGLLTPIDIVPTGELAALDEGDGPELYFPGILADGLTAGVVYATAGGEFIQFDVPKPMLSCSYNTVPGPLIGQELPTNTMLVFSNDLGAVPVDNVVVVLGLSFEAEFFDGRITLNPITDPPFVRGDANADDGISDLADAIWLIQFLFVGGEAPPCMEAADANGDLDVNMGDFMYILNWQLLGGNPPPAPFPDCGLVPDQECVSYDVCP